MATRYSEQEVRRKLMEAFRTSMPTLTDPQPEYRALCNWFTAGAGDDDPYKHPDALRAIGVRWTGSHYVRTGK